MPPRKLTDDDIQRTVTQAVKAARDFIEAEIAPDRKTAQDYFEGKCGLEAEDGRSQVVATKVRDTVRAIKPVLMRVFLQTDKPVEFIPRHPQAVAAASQATSYATSIFHANDGFRVLSDAFHDALIKKAGIVKVFYDESVTSEVDDWSGLDADTLMGILADPENADLEVLESEQGPDGLLSVKVSRTTSEGRIRFDSVPPEDFFVDAAARGIADCLVCGHTSQVRVGDVVAMGFDFEEVLALAGQDTSDDAAEQDRRGYGSTAEEDGIDPSMRPVMLTEAYMRMDIDGTGIPRPYKFICAGDDFTLLTNEDGSLAYEPCDMSPFAVFEVDPEPHTFFGRSLADLIIGDQDAATALLRGLLDSIQMANTPRAWIVEGMVNQEDALNTEIGTIVRMKQPGMMGEFSMGAAATAVLPALLHYDETIQAKTGVMGAAMGLSPDALQQQTATGVDAVVQAAQAQSELIARNLAEGGMRQLFEKIAQLARQHPNREEMIRVDGQFIPVDPRSWAAPMSVVANVGLGTGRHQERLMMLQATLQQQGMLMQAGSPLVTMTNLRATLADLLSLAGIHNADRYYAPMTAEMEAQIQAQQAQAAQGQPQPLDPSTAMIQIEQGKSQVALQRAQMAEQTKLVVARAKDDLERDRMAQELAIKQAEIANGVQADALRAEQAMPRPYGAQPQPAPFQG